MRYETPTDIHSVLPDAAATAVPRMGRDPGRGTASAGRGRRTAERALLPGCIVTA